jgi:fibro-slime domain-containing protein
MTRSQLINRTTYGALAVVASASFLLPDSIQIAMADPPDPPDTIQLPGIIRDFHKSDTNFAVSPSGGNGHYAGNLDLTLGAENRPAFSGGGFKVSSQWRDSATHPIAPHLYSSGGGAGVQVATAPTINNNPTIDTWDSDAGPYGGSNVGPAPSWQTGSAMPAVSAPSPLPPFTNDVMYSGNGTSTLSASLYCKTFTLQNNRTLNISGQRFIYCTETFKIENHTNLVLLAGATLHIYIGKDCTIQNNVNVNMTTWDPSRLTITNLGTKTMTLENHTELCATIISPNAEFHVKNNCDFYGTFTGKSMIIDNSAGVHIEGEAAQEVCGAELNDSLGSAGIASDGGIPSASAFDTWFSDVLGANISAQHTIELVKSLSGVYEYLDDAFHPIDGQLFGNESQAHNFYFTYAIEVDFVHHACDDRFFEFEGADDAWLFVDDDLALDIGGVIPGIEQRIDMDRLSLTDGETYTLRFFYAQRQASVSQFRMRTNLDLVVPEAPLAVSGGFD